MTEAQADKLIRILVEISHSLETIADAVEAAAAAIPNDEEG